jgi:cyclic pyranopterin phosphate synthase
MAPGTPGSMPLDARGRPLRDLRLSVIEACNFRCGYCMPADQVPDDYGLDSASRLSFDEIETLVRGFARIGVNKLRLTGGEPLLRKRLPELIARLSVVPGIEDLALTTNGSLLAAQAQALHRAGLRRLTVSVDALDADLFREMSGGRGEVSVVMAGIDAATRAGFHSLKINCVVQRGINENQVLPLVEHFRGSGHVLRFIEYMDVGTCNGASPRDGRSCRWIPTIAAKWRRATASRTARAKSASSVRSAKPSAAIATARAFRRTGICIPACSRPREPIFAVRLRRAKRRSPIIWPGSGRAARTATASCGASAKPPRAGMSKCS